MIHCPDFSFRAAASSSENIPESEFHALHDLYNATIGQSWNWGKQPGIKWNFTSTANNPCVENWEGLSCTATPVDGFMHIEIVVLDNNNLLGYLPDSIANLTYATELTLRNNVFSGGNIPSTVGEMSRLNTLDLGSTFMQGSIPDIFAGMQALSYLDLSVNMLTGVFLAQYAMPLP